MKMLDHFAPALDNEHNCPRCGAVTGRNYRDRRGVVRGIFLLVRVALPPMQMEVDDRTITVPLPPVFVETKIEGNHNQLQCANCGKMFAWWSRKQRAEEKQDA